MAYEATPPPIRWGRGAPTGNRWRGGVGVKTGTSVPPWHYVTNDGAFVWRTTACEKKLRSGSSTDVERADVPPRDGRVCPACARAAAAELTGRGETGKATRVLTIAGVS